MRRVFGLRGATKVLNDEADIVSQLAVLYDAMLAENNICEDDIISLIFSITDDITVKNPAAALRQSGRAGELTLFSVQEPKTAGSPAGIIRILLHCYMDEGQKPSHVYRNGAEILRPDWAEHKDAKPDLYKNIPIKVVDL
ncbi:MAG: chorismate mutase [Spirochaetaceae bacterium]|jgi:chorismate mutase|nr:chorismate mutase [Spirochaetaceae bacterium]